MKTTLIGITTALALASASPALAATPKIGSVSGAEGTALTIPISHKCGAKKCTYDVLTVDGTASADSDYTQAEVTGKAKKGKTFRTTLNVATTQDTTCEPDETFVVHVDVTNASGTHGYDATETITDDDCTTAQPPAQPTGYQPPANPDGVDITNAQGSGHLQQTCDEAYGKGTPVAPGYRLPECYVTVTCPASASNGCAAYASWGVDSAYEAQFSVSGWGLVHAYDPSGTQLSSDEQYCSGWGSCTMKEPGALNVRAGDTFEADCGGHFDPSKMAPGSDRQPDYLARASCSALLTW